MGFHLKVSSILVIASTLFFTIDYTDELARRMENSHYFQANHPNDVNYLVKIRTGNQSCSGVVIDKGVILTTAFCGDEKLEHVQELDIFQSDSNKHVKAFDWTMHEGFQIIGHKIVKNFALINFDGAPFEYTERPLCKESCNSTFKMKLMGWELSKDGLNRIITAEFHRTGCDSKLGIVYGKLHHGKEIRWGITDMGSPVILHQGEPNECVYAIFSKKYGSHGLELEPAFAMTSFGREWITKGLHLGV